jgi:hypothetical protein
VLVGIGDVNVAETGEPPISVMDPVKVRLGSSIPPRISCSRKLSIIAASKFLTFVGPVKLLELGEIVIEPVPKPATWKPRDAEASSKSQSDNPPVPEL